MPRINPIWYYGFFAPNGLDRRGNCETCDSVFKIIATTDD